MKKTKISIFITLVMLAQIILPLGVYAADPAPVEVTIPNISYIFDTGELATVTGPAVSIVLAEGQTEGDVKTLIEDKFTDTYTVIENMSNDVKAVNGNTDLELATIFSSVIADYNVVANLPTGVDNTTYDTALDGVSNSAKIAHDGELGSSFTIGDFNNFAVLQDDTTTPTVLSMDITYSTAGTVLADVIAARTALNDKYTGLLSVIDTAVNTNGKNEAEVRGAFEPLTVWFADKQTNGFEIEQLSTVMTEYTAKELEVTTAIELLTEDVAATGDEGSFNVGQDKYVWESKYVTKEVMQSKMDSSVLLPLADYSYLLTQYHVGNTEADVFSGKRFVSESEYNMLVTTVASMKSMSALITAGSDLGAVLSQIKIASDFYATPANNVMGSLAIYDRQNPLVTTNTFAVKTFTSSTPGFEIKPEREGNALTTDYPAILALSTANVDLSGSYTDVERNAAFKAYDDAITASGLTLSSTQKAHGILLMNNKEAKADKIPAIVNVEGSEYANYVEQKYIGLQLEASDVASFEASPMELRVKVLNAVTDFGTETLADFITNNKVTAEYQRVDSSNVAIYKLELAKGTELNMFELLPYSDTLNTTVYNDTDIAGATGATSYYAVTPTIATNLTVVLKDSNLDVVTNIPMFSVATQTTVVKAGFVTNDSGTTRGTLAFHNKPDGDISLDTIKGNFILTGGARMSINELNLDGTIDSNVMDSSDILDVAKRYVVTIEDGFDGTCKLVLAIPTMGNVPFIESTTKSAITGNKTVVTPVGDSSLSNTYNVLVFGKKTVYTKDLMEGISIKELKAITTGTDKTGVAIGNFTTDIQSEIDLATLDIKNLDNLFLYVFSTNKDITYLDDVANEDEILYPTYSYRSFVDVPVEVVPPVVVPVKPSTGGGSSSGGGGGSSSGGGSGSSSPTSSKVSTPAVVKEKAPTHTNSVVNTVMKDAVLAKDITIEGTSSVVAVVGNAEEEVKATVAKETMKDSTSTSVKVETETMSYSLPMDVVNEFAVVDIEFTPVAEGTAAALDAIANKQNLTVLSTPVDFTVTGYSETGVKSSVKVFDNYVERSITVEAPLNTKADDLMGAVVREGKFYPVPSKVVKGTNGEFTVTLLSKTNSIYTVVSTTRANVKGAEGHWSADVVNDLAGKNLIRVSDTFEPDMAITRIDFLVNVIRTAGLLNEELVTTAERFDDVDYTKVTEDTIAISVARELGIVKGSGDNTFKPSDSISRQEVAAIMSRVVEVIGEKANLAEAKPYEDNKVISSWALGCVYEMQCLSLMKGSSNNFNPQGTLTNGESAQLASNLYALIVE